MSWIKDLFHLEIPPVQLTGRRFWLVWSLCAVVNIAGVLWHPEGLRVLVHLLILAFLGAAAFRPNLLSSFLNALIAAIAAVSQALNLVLLFLLYVLLLTPLGFFYRTFSGSSLNQKVDPSLKTYRIPSAELDPQHFERPF